MGEGVADERQGRQRALTGPMLELACDGGCAEQVAAALIACAGHKAPSVRYKVAMHLDACVQGSNGQRLSGAWGPAIQSTALAFWCWTEVIWWQK